MELTKEYFDKAFKQLPKTEDFDKLSQDFTKLNQKVGSMESNFDSRLTDIETKVSNLVIASADWVTAKEMSNQLANVVRYLEKHIDESQEELARMVGDGFLDVLARLDVRDRVTRVEKNVKKIGLVLNLELEA
jgi:hypothetical protein